jgi:RNA polymerase sigma factor (sigma-70 family)
MATNMSKVLKHIHRLLAPPGGDVADGELLARFVASRDEDSFAALVRRHGPMVLGVCRRMLRHAQDAEDCFQATFMVLARKAATVKRESVSSWLYAVAYRTSLEAKAINARRRAREMQVQEMPHPEVLPSESQDWRPWLDQELNRLPEPYRAAIVACDLEGRSRKDAAHLLGLAEGTLSSRLARGRRLLAKRLAPYGLSLSGATLATMLGENAALAQLPAALLSSTTKAAVLVAAGEFTAVSASSAILMKGVMKSMFIAKLKLIVGAVMIVTALGASGLAYRATGQAPVSAEKRGDRKPMSELERLRHENELLKVNLEVVLEKVRAQDAELRTLRERTKGSDAKSLDEEARRLNELQQEQNIKEMQKKLEDLFKSIQKKPGQSSQPANLQSSNKGVKSTELEIRSAPANRLDSARSDLFMWRERAEWSKRMSQPGRQYVTVAQAEADQARLRNAILDEAAAALKVLRNAPDTESQRKAADALDEALKTLREQLKKSDTNKNP